MNLEALETFDDLTDYLMEREPIEEDRISQMNPGFTKKEIWDFHIKMCLEHSGEDLPKRSRDILLKNIKKDFI